MSPAARFHGLISTLTVFVMFWLITYAVPKLLIYDNPIDGAGTRVNLLLSWFLTFLGSVGAYRLLAWGLAWLLHRSLTIRSWIFGPSFLHGTWVGSFVGHSGDKRFIVEKFDQDLDGIVVNGRSYMEDLQPHGQWTSEAISVDARGGRLTYTYAFDIVSRSITLDGICTFQFDRRTSHEAPHSITGYSHDQNDKTRIAVHHVKVSNALLPWGEALTRAVERFS